MNQNILLNIDDSKLKQLQTTLQETSTMVKNFQKLCEEDTQMDFATSLTTSLDTLSSVFAVLLSFKGLFAPFEQGATAVTTLSTAFGSLTTVLPMALAFIGLFVGVFNYIKDENADCVQGIDLLTGKIDAMTKLNIQPFADQLTSFAETLTQISFSGDIIDDEIVQDTMAKTEAISGFVKSTLQAAQEEELENLRKYGNLSDEQYAIQAEAIQEKYQTQIEAAQGHEDQIREILETAQLEKRELNEQEATELMEHMEALGTQSIEYLNATEEEKAQIQENFLANNKYLRAQNAVDTYQEAKTTKENVIALANEQYQGVLASLDNLKESGDISQEEYEAMREDAKNTKEATENAAKEGFENFKTETETKLGDARECVDLESGKIRKNSYFTQLAIDGIDGSSAGKNVSDDIYKNYNPVFFYFEKYSGGSSTVGKVKPQRFALGGLVSPGQLFLAREAGPELVGTLGSHTAVMNNDMIVEAVSSGVYKAVRSAMGEGGQGSYTFHITNHLDGREIGKQVVKYHNGVVRQTGESPLMI